MRQFCILLAGLAVNSPWNSAILSHLSTSRKYCLIPLASRAAGRHGRVAYELIESKWQSLVLLIKISLFVLPVLDARFRRYTQKAEFWHKGQLIKVMVKYDPVTCLYLRFYF